MAQLDAFKNYNIDFSLNLLSESSTYQSLGYWALSVGESLSIREAKRCQMKQCGIYFLFCFISYASERTVVWDWFTQKKLRQRILR